MLIETRNKDSSQWKINEINKHPLAFLTKILVILLLIYSWISLESNRSFSNVLEEQKAQFLESIQNFYDKEKKYDLMPKIRITIKGKDLENKRKLIRPLQDKEPILSSKNMNNKNLQEKKRETNKLNLNSTKYNDYTQNTISKVNQRETLSNDLSVNVELFTYWLLILNIDI